VTPAETARASRAGPIARALAPRVRTEKDLYAIVIEQLDNLGDPILRFEDWQGIVREVVRGAWLDAWPDEDATTISSYLDIAPSPDELARLAASPPIIPIATHLLYPHTTTVYCGQTGTGKTTSTLRVAVDLAHGLEPWTGRVDGREPRRILLVSKDDTTLSIVRKIAELAPDDAWMADGRITIIGKEKRPGRLDAAGLEILGNTIADGRFGVFVIDPYQHFLPNDWTVNDDAGAQHMIENLDALTESLDAAGLLIHHPRKRPPKARGPLEMAKSERLEEIRDPLCWPSLRAPWRLCGRSSRGSGCWTRW
jgi:hypothetical protein